MKMSIDSGAFGLLVNANKRSSFDGTRYYFKGDLIQMAEARNVASKLGLFVDVEGGIPFVTSKEDYDKVKQHIIDHRIEGWWHYVSREQYAQMK